MPRRRSGLKRLRVDKKRHLKNIKVKKQLKKVIKQFRMLLSTKKVDEAKTLLRKVYSSLDRAAKKKIIHPNTASRKKSRLMRNLSRTGSSKAT